jgi:hypothetical protein
MKSFPVQREKRRRTWLIGRNARCTRCALPACIRLGIGGQRYCIDCVVKLLRRRKETRHHQRQHSC